MWSDNDIDNAFRRLDPPEPEPTPFPLDGWLQLETQLDKAVVARAVRRKLWQFLAAEVAVLLLVALGWLLWPTGAAAPEKTVVATVKSEAGRSAPRETADLTTAEAPRTSVPMASGAAPALIAQATNGGAVQPLPTPALPPRTTPAITGGTAEPTPKRMNAPFSGKSPLSTTLLASSDRRIRSGRAARQMPSPVAGHVAIVRTGENAAAAVAAPTGRPAAESVGAVPLAATTTKKRIRPDAKAFGSAASRGAAYQGERAEGRQPLRSKQDSNNTTLLENGETREDAAAGEPNASRTEVSGLALHPVSLLLSGTAELPAPLAPVPVAAPAEAPLPLPVRRCGLVLGLVGAPDVSTVQSAPLQSPLLNMGVLVEYRLTSRLRLSTGLLRSAKQYQARREDYNWEKYPRAGTREFTWVNAACTVLDVPLNLRYDVVARPNGRVFGAAGVSSFFMQREQYTYDYLENGQPAIWDRAVVNENQHLLSILNLSVGYERNLGTHWRLQAEPYLKLPLGGVGVGKVRLTSAGVFFGVKYEL